MKKVLSYILLWMLVILAPGCGRENFFEMSNRSNEHFPSGDPSGTDALSASTNFSGKEGETAPKLDPLAGSVYIPAPQPGNYGTVNLSYPIQLPGGRAGMQPSVGLSYSSSGGDGLAGIGWSVSTGLACISRTTSSGELYYDSRDTFTYNGKRLVKVRGSASGEEGVYRCEIESDFTRFELRSTSSG
ncbi:MAG: SpvB/TcaC N-terminal domain-containing protein, partial [Spirochaetota bacterium]